MEGRLTTGRGWGEFPPLSSPEVRAEARRIMGFVRGEDRINSFLREYLGHSLERMAMNYLYLKGNIAPDDACLDVGSLGVEYVLLKRDYPRATFEALSYEGGRVGIAGGVFYETLDPNDGNCVTIRQVDVERQPMPFADASFDVVSCFETIEHLKFTPMPMMREMNRVLKTGGRLVLTTPNINSSWAISKILRGRSPSEEPRYNKNPEYGIIHAKEYTMDELAGLARACGFTVEHLFSYDDEPLEEGEAFVRRHVGRFMARLDGRWFGRYRQAELHLGHRLALVAKKTGEAVDEFPEVIFQ